MDAFYASVEQRDDPSLRGKPLIVGGPGRRGVVTAASYEVRPFGVRSAMSMSEALRRCPHAIVVAPHFARYTEASRRVFAIFRRVTPLVEGLSLDEAFLDVTASRALFGDGRAIAQRIKDEIRDELSLTASAGVAPSKFVAKIASDLDKPDGLVVVSADEVPAFLAPLPIERMWGIGRKSAPRMHDLGFHTFADLARCPEETLARLLGDHGPELARLARGEDTREVEPGREAKSIGAEETFDSDLRSIADIEKRLLAQAERVASRLHADGLAARGLTVKIKYADFTLKTRATRLREAAADTDTLFKTARALLRRFDLRERGVRLCGVSASDLVAAEIPETLFPDPSIVRGKKLEAAAAALRERFGDATLTRAELLDRSRTPRSPRAVPARRADRDDE